MRNYRVVTEVFVQTDDGEWEKAASIGDVVEAESFNSALVSFNKALNKQWDQVANMAPIIDEDLTPDPQEKEGEGTG